MRKNNRYRLAAFFSRTMELPLEGFCEIPVFCIRGRNEVELSGCTGVLEYEETRVVIKTTDGVCTMHGKGLILSDFHNDLLRVRGRIDSVDLVSEEDKSCSKD